MKEATGDMSMTVIVIIGVVALLVFARTVVWPAIQTRITDEMDFDKGKNNNAYVEVVEDYNI